MFVANTNESARPHKRVDDVMQYFIPAGLVYLIGKHYIDRYNLYYAYQPSKINRQIHTSAINFVIVALIILQFNMLFYNILRTSKCEMKLHVGIM